MIAKLNITLTRTADGKAWYLQAISDDMLVNVVLVAAKVELQDLREKAR